jgi:hypothetical protein
MAASVGPIYGLVRSEHEEPEMLAECKNCGAPGVALAHKCGYCASTTPHGARQARLARLMANSRMNANSSFGANAPDYTKDTP